MSKRRREVTVWAEASTYRARIVPSTKGLFRKRHGFSFVIERAWSKLASGTWGARSEDWRPSSPIGWYETREAAETAADEWLDAAEARNPNDEDYR